MSGKILTKTGLPILLEKKGSATFGKHRLLRSNCYGAQNFYKLPQYFFSA